MKTEPTTSSPRHMGGEKSRLTPMLNTKEAAKMLGKAPGTLRRWRCERKGPPYVQGLGYREEDVREYITARVRTPHVQAA